MCLIRLNEGYRRRSYASGHSESIFNQLIALVVENSTEVISREEPHLNEPKSMTSSID